MHLSSLTRVAQTSVYRRIYLTVFGWNSGTYRIFIRGAGMHTYQYHDSGCSLTNMPTEATVEKPFFLLPMDMFYFMGAW